MSATLRKWKAVFSIYFQDGIAYRASGLIWVTTDVATAVTMPLVWAAASKSGPIGGFSSSDFILYYLCMLFLGSFIMSHIMWELAMEIKEGQFSTMLLRPMSFYQLNFFRNLSWRVIRPVLFAPFFFGLLFAYRGYLTHVDIHLGWDFWLSVVLGHCVSFSFVMMMSMLALFTQEVSSLFELYYIPMLFLSGQLFPIAMLPAWASHLAKLFPFYFMTGGPTEILIGRVQGDAAIHILVTQVVWIAICYVISKVLWSKGLKHYTGVGM